MVYPESPPIQDQAAPGYKNAPRVFVIVDNGSDHRGQAATDRQARAHPNAIMIHTPRHASSARPFSWKFTASDLHDLMDPISRHEQQDNPQDKPLPEAA